MCHDSDEEAFQMSSWKLLRLYRIYRIYRIYRAKAGY
jgi:hypothetical protein